MRSDIGALPSATAGVPSARSWLFVPGDRGDRFAKAAASGADVVICDLEDAVAADMKASARAEAARWLEACGVACVRINAYGTPFYDADVPAAGLAAPVDGVSVALDDLSVVEADAASVVSLGFGSKLCIHPSQVRAVNAAFRPSEEDVRRARRILDSVTDGGVARLDGQMVDRPVMEHARLVLQRAGLKPRP